MATSRGKRLPCMLIPKDKSIKSRCVYVIRLLKDQIKTFNKKKYHPESRSVIEWGAKEIKKGGTKAHK